MFGIFVLAFHYHTAVPLDVTQKDDSKNNQADASKVDIEIQFYMLYELASLIDD